MGKGKSPQQVTESDSANFQTQRDNTFRNEDLFNSMPPTSLKLPDDAIMDKNYHSDNKSTKRKSLQQMEENEVIIPQSNGPE
jgi:hypothetical protein